MITRSGIDRSNTESSDSETNTSHSNSNSNSNNDTDTSDEIRKARMFRNKMSARKTRIKKKMYIRALESRIEMLVYARETTIARAKKLAAVTTAVSEYSQINPITRMVTVDCAVLDTLWHAILEFTSSIDSMG